MTTEIQPYAGPLAPILNQEVRRMEFELSDWDLVKMSDAERQQYGALVDSAKAHGLEVVSWRDMPRKATIFVIWRGPLDLRTGEIWGYGQV